MPVDKSIHGGFGWSCEVVDRPFAAFPGSPTWAKPVRTHSRLKGAQPVILAEGPGQAPSIVRESDRHQPERRRKRPAFASVGPLNRYRTSHPEPASAPGKRDNEKF